jgi:hypothetical protein
MSSVVGKQAEMSVPTSQKTKYLSYKTNRLMLLMQTIAVRCETHTKHTNTLRGQGAERPNVEAVGSRSRGLFQGLNCDRIPGKVKRFLSHPKGLVLWGPPSPLLNGYRERYGRK